MKALIIGILSLTILSACATMEIATDTVPQVPAGAVQGVCNSKDGIFVILVNNQGQQQAYLCPSIRGKTISQKDTLPADLIEASTVDLGTARKLKLNNDPDPCMDWLISGRHYYFCW